MASRPRRQSRRVSDRVQVRDDEPAEVHPQVAYQRELQAAKKAGRDIVITELGAAVSHDVGNRRPASWPEGRPIMRGGQWV